MNRISIVPVYVAKYRDYTHILGGAPRTEGIEATLQKPQNKSDVIEIVYINNDLIPTPIPLEKFYDQVTRCFSCDATPNPFNTHHYHYSTPVTKYNKRRLKWLKFITSYLYTPPPTSRQPIRSNIFNNPLAEMIKHILYTRTLNLEM